MGKSIKKTFRHDLQKHFPREAPPQEILTHEDIRHLPAAVQRCLEVCGYVGHEKIVSAEVQWADSHIKMKPGGKWMRLKTLQYNGVNPPFRIAYMKAMMMGMIPFEGRDLYAEGQGHMFGKIAQVVSVFDEKNPQVAQSALVIILAESMLIPGYALSEHITWEARDDRSARATMQHEGLEASGTFFFDEAGLMVRFESAERYYQDPQEGPVLRPFKAFVGGYHPQGVLRVPRTLLAAWELKTGLYEYWKGTIKAVRYNIRPGE
ncbi:MAG: DUF6544 family protein [Bacteroidales bacterium]